MYRIEFTNMASQEQSEHNLVHFLPILFQITQAVKITISKLRFQLQCFAVTQLH